MTTISDNLDPYHVGNQDNYAIRDHSQYDRSCTHCQVEWKTTIDGPFCFQCGREGTPGQIPTRSTATEPGTKETRYLNQLANGELETI